MIDPSKVCLFIPNGLTDFKRKLFKRIGQHIRDLGGRTVSGDYGQLDRLPDHIIPIVGCSPELKPLIDRWKARGRDRIQWDRGYARRVFATWLPRGENGGYYRWHLNAYQMQAVRDVPDDRWQELIPGNNVDPRTLRVLPWRRDGRHIVIAQPSTTYIASHGIEGWAKKTIAEIRKFTDRKIILREKLDPRALKEDIEDAYCLVAHGSIAAVESVIMGCPVFVHPDSAAALVGLTDLSKIESPVYPEREKWLHSLAYCQFSEKELCDGTLWRLIE